MGTEWATRLVHKFDEQYYETGKTDGISWYDNYKWEAERSRSEVAAFRRVMGPRDGDRVVDFGCAKGFWVRAALESGLDAWGLDISEYARVHCDPAAFGRVLSPLDNTHRYQFGFAKDTLEHVAYEDIDDAVAYMASICPRWLMAIPLAENGRYVIPEYELETTHIIREDMEWWLGKVGRRLAISLVSAKVDGLKDKWHAAEPRGNVFIVTDGTGGIDG